MQRNRNSYSDQSSNSSKESVSSNEVECSVHKTFSKTATLQAAQCKQSKNESFNGFKDAFKGKIDRKDDGDGSVKKEDEKDKSISSDEEKIKISDSDSHSKLNADSSESKSDIRKKRKHRRRPITICTANCRYEVVRRVAYRIGMREVPEDESWNLFWTDLSISVERCKEMKRFQKINHFPGMTEICRKDLLARNLNRMLKIFPKDYCFFPKTWCLPADMGDLQAYARVKRNKTYILKPDTGCQGRGIYLTKSVKDLKPQEKMICQVYIAKPFLIDGYKCDFRIYTLITSCDPLRIFVYNDGLVRFATSRYREPTGHNTTNVYMHLTNYAVNKHSRTYVVDDELGSKRKISTLNKWFESKDYNLEDIWASTDDVIIKTIIAAHPMLKHSYHTCFPTHDYTYACFELLGFDILLDQNLKPYVLEVNHSPSFHCDSQIDKDIKEGLLKDTFEILNLQQCDKRKIMEEDRRRIRERLLQGIYKDQSVTNDIGATLSRNPLQMQTDWEEKHKGNFRKIYPSHGSESYDKFFNQNLSSLFQDTAASRAREEASRVQREESMTRAKQEALRRNGGKLILEKLRPESPLGKTKSAKKINIRKTKENTEVKKTLSNSFDPVPIVESEEIERQHQLKQRDFLVRSYGLIEQKNLRAIIPNDFDKLQRIYLCLKKNRTLRPEDEAKYGLYERQSTNNLNFISSSKKFKSLAQINVNATNSKENQALKTSQIDVITNSVTNNNISVTDINAITNAAHTTIVANNNFSTNPSVSAAINININANVNTGALGGALVKSAVVYSPVNKYSDVGVQDNAKLTNTNINAANVKNGSGKHCEERGDKLLEKDKFTEKGREIEGVHPEVSNKGLYVSCREIPLPVRPIPSHSWPYSGSNNPPMWTNRTGPVANSNVGYENNIRCKKVQTARPCKSNIKLRHLEKREKYHYRNLDLFVEKSQEK